MGNTQSAEGGHRHGDTHQVASAGASGGGSGGLGHRFSRRSKTGSRRHSGQNQQLKQPAQQGRGVDFVSPVVGSPLPENTYIGGAYATNNVTSPGIAPESIPVSTGEGTAKQLHTVMPEAIPMTLPKQGGLAKIMGPRDIIDGMPARSPANGISAGPEGVPQIVVPPGATMPAEADMDIDDAAQKKRPVPTLIRWVGPGTNVYISGSFIDWQYKIRLHENDGMHGIVVDLPVGTHCLKFIVDGRWKCSDRFIIAPDDDGNLVNYFKVEDVVEEDDKSEDFEGIDARNNPAVLSNSPPGGYGTEIPDLVKFAAQNARDGGSSRRNDPPMLPPHLNQVLLNSTDMRSDDPNVLPVPNHVVLNHLYACSIKDNVMAVSSTSRYRGKYLTTIYYKPVIAPNH